jgi:hypothetical protein
VEGTSLAPLAALADLELLEFGVTLKTSLAPLLGCQSLRRVRVHGPVS